MTTTSKITKLASSKRSLRFEQIILSVAAWALFVLTILLTALLIGWALLGIVLLGTVSGGTPVPVILLALLVLTSLLAWVTARFFASWRKIGQTIGLIFGLVFVVGMSWVVSAPNQALYMARGWLGVQALSTPTMIYFHRIHSMPRRYPSSSQYPPTHEFKNYLGTCRGQAIGTIFWRRMIPRPLS